MTSITWVAPRRRWIACKIEWYEIISPVVSGHIPVVIVIDCDLGSMNRINHNVLMIEILQWVSYRWAWVKWSFVKAILSQSVLPPIHNKINCREFDRMNVTRMCWISKVGVIEMIVSQWVHCFAHWGRIFESIHRSQWPMSPTKASVKTDVIRWDRWIDYRHSRRATWCDRIRHWNMLTWRWLAVRSNRITSNPLDDTPYHSSCDVHDNQQDLSYRPINHKTKN